MPNSETIIYANARFIPLHYTNEKWNTSNPVLLDGEYGFVDDAADANHWIKKGDGVKHWNELDYILFNNADISNKQDKIDNSLETSDKTIVGAINELNSNKGTYSKPSGGIPKSDLSSAVKASLDKADTALQSHQDISGKADKSYVDTGLSNKVDKEQGKGLFSGSYNDLTNKPDIPTKTSVLTNDSGFITNAVNNLINYYLKSETYNKTEINSLISQIQTSHFEIVAVLPTVGERNVIYLLPRQITETGNIYDEYIYISNAYEKIGSTDVDLTGYATETWVNAQIAEKENTSNKVTSLSSQSTDTQYPSAKCVYDIVGDIESLLNALR